MTRCPLWPQAVWDGASTLMVTLWAPHPSPALRAQVWEHGTALGGATRPSAVRRCAHQSRRKAEHPEQAEAHGREEGLQHLQVGFSRVAAGAADSDAAVARRETPLHLAAANGHGDVMAALIGAGADVTIKNEHGWAFQRPVRPGAVRWASAAVVARRETPLHTAAYYGNAAATAALINAGADVAIENADGWAF
jgi:hypothetical protein